VIVLLHSHQVLETPVTCEIDGIVTAISAKSGQAMQVGDKILKIDQDQ